MRDRRFRTAKGAGVGSTLGELKRLYTVDSDWGEDGPVAIVTALDLTFVLDGESYAARVKTVWVYPQPAKVRQKKCPDRR